MRRRILALALTALVPAGAAAVSTLVYRLASYSVPLAAGGVAWPLQRRRHGAADDLAQRAGATA